ncbi:pickpocket protein 28-like [Diprion similis]|uniref:pickpocket protein 28-like n=1 Tax=Diprion similis TaxID=362088 RepID=UPI001EF86637|nr:pickpocket protein 28-like [Diprion similis]
MAPTVIHVKTLKDYEQNVVPYYLKDVVSDVVKRKIFKPEDVGRLGRSAAQVGMGKIKVKTPMSQYIVDFFNKSTIHGLNHIVAPRRHFIERILTVIFVGTALGCLVASSLQYSWFQYQNNPTTIVLDIDYKNFNVTKPALTICMDDYISTDKFPDVFKKFGVEDTQEARNFFQFISRPVYSTLNETPIYNGTSPNNWLQILQDLHIDYEPNQCGLQECTGTYKTLVVTEKGICATLYGAYSNYSSVDYWVSNNWTIFPQRSLPTYKYARRNDRINIQAIPLPYEASSHCSFQRLDFITTLALHYPNDLPQLNSWWYNFKEVAVVDIRVAVQQTESSDELRQLSKSQRECNFPEDGELKMWPVYTYNMCILECRYNFIKGRCGCYPYFARPMPGVPVCNSTQLHCIGSISDSIISLKSSNQNLCTCPENCNTARYNNIRTGTAYNIDRVDVIPVRTVNIDIEFPFIKMRREVFFGFTEFLVSVGGAAGLFLGASIISFIEIFYHLTLKLFWYRFHISRNGRQ